jgi:methionine-rich copper-binding protein CopC
MPKLALVLVWLAVGAWAHARLERSWPADGSTVEAAPRVELWFDGHVEPKFHQLELIGSDGVRRPLEGVVDEADPRHLGAPLPSIGPGRWTVRYEVVSRDGHRVEGQLTFQVR